MLVQEFLKAVHEMKPRWWIMENVPRITRFLPEEVPLRWIGIEKDGEIAVQNRAVFNTADYGVPQTRRRFLMGNFPIPKPTHYNVSESGILDLETKRLPWRTLGEALASLPNPLREITTGDIVDFNYEIKIPVSQLSDHFHDCILSDEEVHRVRKAKILHPYMGFMAFPDRLDRPARTVVATQLGRETLVIGTKIDDRDVFRRATIRECAVLQTFPITYQFWGSNLAARYRLVGDAVPPMLGYRIGCAILEAEGKPLPKAPLVQTRVLELSPKPAFPTSWGGNINHHYRLNRRFREFIPGKEIRGCRVDLDNQGSNPGQAPLAPIGVHHICEWVARLYVGEGKTARQRPVSVDEALKELIGYCINTFRENSITDFLEEIDQDLNSRLPDATTLQAAWCGLVQGVNSPVQVAEQLSAIVDRHFPRKQFHEVRVPPSETLDIVPKGGFRLRILGGLVATSYACELINNDPRWILSNENKRFIPSHWLTFSSEYVRDSGHNIESLSVTFRRIYESARNRHRERGLQ